MELYIVGGIFVVYWGIAPPPTTIAKYNEPIIISSGLSEPLALKSDSQHDLGLKCICGGLGE
jgi:hypothetical protein